MIGKLAIGILLVAAFYWLGTHPNTHEFADNSQPPVVLEEKTGIHSSPKFEALTEPLTRSIATLSEVEFVKEIDAPVKVEPQSNEKVVWDKLIATGYTRNQAAGVLGNLRQEHNFKTNDVPGGLGIAQWMGGRRANLMAKPNYTDIHVQADFIIEELTGAEHRANRALKASGSVEQATRAFQNQYERCNPRYCHEAKRIQYAYEFLGRF